VKSLVRDASRCRLHLGLARTVIQERMGCNQAEAYLCSGRRPHVPLSVPAAPLIIREPLKLAGKSQT
jgi:hypothetical protein